MWLVSERICSPLLCIPIGRNSDGIIYHTLPVLYILYSGVECVQCIFNPRSNNFNEHQLELSFYTFEEIKYADQQEFFPLGVVDLGRDPLGCNPWTDAHIWSSVKQTERC